MSLAFCSSRLTQEPNSTNMSIPQLYWVICIHTAAKETAVPSLHSAWKKNKFIRGNKFRHQCLSAVPPKITNYKSCTLILAEREVKFKKKKSIHQHMCRVEIPPFEIPKLNCACVHFPLFCLFVLSLYNRGFNIKYQSFKKALR